MMSSHYTDSYINEEKDKRPIDGAVIVAFNDGYADDHFFTPTDVLVAQTVKAYNQKFCEIYDIN